MINLFLDRTARGTLFRGQKLTGIFANEYFNTDYPNQGENEIDDILSDCICFLPGVDSLRAMNGSTGLMSALSRILAVDLNYDYKNYGGWVLMNDGSMIVDYYDGESSLFNKAYNSFLNNLKDHKARHQIYHISCNSIQGYDVNSFGTGIELKFKCEANRTGHTLAGLAYAIMCYILKRQNPFDTHCSYILHILKHYDELKQAMLHYDQNDWSVEEAINIGKKFNVVCNDFYCLLCGFVNYTSFNDVIDMTMFKSSTLALIDNDFDYSNCVEEFNGDSNFFKAKVGTLKLKDNKIKTKAIEIVKTIKDYVKEGTFKMDHDLTEAEMLAIPNMNESYIPPKECISTANSIIKSTGFPSPQRFFLWEGETGTGKSTSCQLLAEMLQMPYYPMSLSGNTYSDDLLTSITPNVDKLSQEEFLDKMARCPYTDEKQRNEYAYELVQKTKDFVEVPSPLFYALTQGGVCEMIEANVVKGNQLKILNSLLDDLATITINGKTYKRHPDCVIVITCNTGAGYEGIHPFGKDFRSRVHEMRVFGLPSNEELLVRAKTYSKGLVKDETLRKMLEVYNSMKEEVDKYGDMYDVVSPRQLYKWAQVTAYTEDPYQSALDTIVGLASEDSDLRQKLIEALQQHFYSVS